MNVAIIGNSNCVFTNGFTAGVSACVKKMGGVVRNYSLGGSCCGLHIYTFHDKQSELLDADLIILDSLVIDSFHFKRGVIKEGALMTLIDDMYAIYSTLPAKIVSVLFPIERNVSNYSSNPIYSAHMVAANKYGVDVVDIYALFPKDIQDYSPFFMQPSHIRVDLARDIGFRLVGYLGDVEKKAGAFWRNESPYEILNDDVFHELESIPVGSSLYEATCYRLDRGISLEQAAGKSLVGVLHWNKSCDSRFVVGAAGNEDVVHCRSSYAFFEVIHQVHKIESDTILKPGGACDTLTQKPAGKSRNVGLGIPQIAGLLMRGAGEIDLPAVSANEDLSSRLGNVFG